MVKAASQGISKLYHYQAFEPEYLKDTLINNRVHFSSPTNFNDPWDCRPQFDVATVSDPAVRAKWGEVLGHLVQNFPSHVLKRIGTPWFENQPFLISTIKQVTAEVWKNNGKRWRLYCLTPHPDTVLMWSHYADKHKGICLEFDAGIEAMGRALQVTYTENLPVIGPHMLQDHVALTEAILLTKSADWSYENEFRVLARDGDADPKFATTTQADFLPLPVGALRAVIVGANADVKVIRDLIREHAPSLAVRRADCSATEYKLTIVEYLD